MMTDCLDLWAIIPELIMAGVCIVLVPLASFMRGRWLHAPAYLAASGLVAAMIFTVRMLNRPAAAVFCGTYAIDSFGTVFTLLLEIGALIALFVLAAYFRQRPQIVQAPAALLFATLGGTLLASSVNLISILLFIQLLNMASYVLVALVRGNQRGNEATLKYMIYSAVVLAVMACGASFLYGLTGSLEVRAIGRGLENTDSAWVLVGCGLLLLGYAVEITLVPFHFWSPATYNRTAAPVAGFLSVVPKIAGFAGLLRFVLMALPGSTINWPVVLAILAAVSMTFANLMALRQSSLKRVLAYSSIAQTGYVLVAAAVSDRAGNALSAVGYYLAAYLFMNLGAFTIVAQVERATGSDDLLNFRGLARTTPGAAAALAISLLSLAGFPPMAGFVGKVVLLGAAMDGSMTWLAIVAVANIALALFYYAPIIGEMYLKPPEQPQRVPGNSGYTLAAGLCLFGTFALVLGASWSLTFMQQIGNMLF